MRKGILVQVYVAINPKNDDILSEEYNTPFEIPEFLEDFDQEIPRDETEVIPLYKDAERSVG